MSWRRRSTDTFSGKTVLLTGAGGGIGRAMALMLADEKADLALVDLDSDAVDETQTACRARGAGATVYRCDMGLRVDIDGMFAQVSADLGPVDVLINSAGTVVGKYVHQYEYVDLKQTMLVNYVGGAYLTRLVLPGMMSRNEGHIVNMASVIGLVAMPQMGEYVASKFAIVGFTETIRMELKKAGYTGVKTLCVCTTGVDTGLFPGYRAPRLTPLLKPEVVAREVLKAAKKGRSHLEIPLVAKMIPSIKLLPVCVQDAILTKTGFTSSMDGFRAADG
ncbi:MAG: SDR family NAD(P)-dependent oxidoreductase [Thermoleophilia bacterium]|nr:SDR family NAD(P)-dependent oxidoreductase [Thermoleophilia bacterium]